MLLGCAPVAMYLALILALEHEELTDDALAHAQRCSELVRQGHSSEQVGLSRAQDEGRSGGGRQALAEQRRRDHGPDQVARAALRLLIKGALELREKWLPRGASCFRRRP